MSRLYPLVEHRLLVTKWDPSTPQVEPLLTFLDRRATNRSAHFALGAPASFEGIVASDDPEINILHDDNFSLLGNFETSDYPFLAEGVRLLTWLRREHSEIAPHLWMPRFRGPLLLTNDGSDPDEPLTRFVAYDPWSSLFSRPCLRCLLQANSTNCQTVGGLAVVDPTPRGIVVFPAGTELQFIVGEMLRRTISANGPVMIDAGDGSSGSGDGNDYGGSADWAGTIETCATLTAPWVIQDGASVGELWQQIHETGLAKIILTPVYDENRPGICADLSIFRTDTVNNGLADRQGADFTDFPLFSWDRSGHDISDISRVVDGTQRSNKLQFLGPSGYRAGVVTSSPSVARFGEQWAQEQFNRLTRQDQIDVQARKQVLTREQGRRTWEIAPVAEFTYRPFQDYDLGYYVAIYHSNRLREDATNYNFTNALGLITEFRLDLSDEGSEVVSGLLADMEEGVMVAPF